MLNPHAETQLLTINHEAGARVINILYGSQTGNSEFLAHDTAAAAKAHGLSPDVKSMDNIEFDVLADMQILLVITSTYGEGEMPDNAQLLWDQISADSAPGMEKTQYSVLALGDASYDNFCQAGADWDARLAELGANRICERIDCDAEFEDPAENWIRSVVSIIAGDESVSVIAEDTEEVDKPIYNRRKPFPSSINAKRLLTANNSSKEIHHFELALSDFGQSYEAGDALHIIPQNCSELVTSTIEAIGCSGDEKVIVEGESRSLFEALLNDFEIKLPSKEFLHEIARRSGDRVLGKCMKPESRNQLNTYLWGRDTLDILLQFSEIKFSPAEFIDVLRPLQDRAYSISSSGKTHPNCAHLTIASVRYCSHGRDHKGVCSTYIADLVDKDTKVNIYLSPNKSFRLPKNSSLPIIMVGPGTGIAPFIAFLQEREFIEATGKNWLFFGDRNIETDYIYREEIEAMKENGVLTRLDLAFSRDQKEKIYVQDRMRSSGKELYSWLQQGGFFFVCGDINHMAKDVDTALHNIIEAHGNKTKNQAIDYVNQLKKEKRYLRDVY